jgi:hypothetical protein
MKTVINLLRNRKLSRRKKLVDNYQVTLNKAGKVQLDILVKRGLGLPVALF